MRVSQVAARLITGVAVASCAQAVGIHELTVADGGGAGDAGLGSVDSCEGGASQCCAALSACCPKLASYPDLQQRCSTAAQAGDQQSCAELLYVYRPQCP